MAEPKSYSTEDMLYFGRRLREGICQLQSAQVAAGITLYDFGQQILEVPLKQLGVSLHPEDAQWREKLPGQRMMRVEEIREACLGDSVASYQKTTEDPSFYVQRMHELRGSSAAVAQR
jgi:hypothetical protein